MAEAPTPVEPLTEEEMIADAAWMVGNEHHEMVGLVMNVIDLVDGIEQDGRTVNFKAMRKTVGLQIRRSIARAHLALEQFDDPDANVVCERCGMRADLLAENPLDDWELARVNELQTGILCPVCKDADEDESGGDA